MTDFLTALKAAHEKATPGPWVGVERVSMPPGMDGSRVRADSDLATLLVNAAPELVALVEAARAVAAQHYGRVSHVVIGADFRGLVDALAALDKVQP